MNNEDINMLCKLSAEPTDVTLGEDPTFSTVVFFLKIFGSRFPLHLVSNATAVCLQGGGEETRSSSWSVGCEVLGKLLESRECLNSKCQREKPTFLYTSACIVTQIQHLSISSSHLWLVFLESQTLSEGLCLLTSDEKAPR